MRKIFYLLAICINSSLIYSQNSVYGYLSDCSSTESIIGGTIQIGNTGTSTNNQGYFFLELDSNYKYNDIVFTFIGFKTVKIKYNDFKNGQTVCLEQGIELDEITIELTNTKIQQNERLNISSIPIEQAKKIPMLLGEVDIIKALQYKAGIGQGYEGSAGLFVRGGTPDQNLFLVDDNQLYNSSHLLGFISAINSDAIKSLELHKGYFPAKYGGRLSSIVDVQLKDGNKNKTDKEFSIGLVSSKFGISKPITNKTTLSINSRLTYLNLVGLVQKIRYNKNLARNYQNYWFYDFNGKIHYRISEKEHLYFTVFNSNDNYRNTEKVDSSLENISTNTWGSTLLGMRYTKIIQNNFILNFTIGYNQFISKITGNSVLSFNNLNTNFRSHIKGINAKVNFDYNLKKHTLNFGIEHKTEDISPGILKTNNNILKLLDNTGIISSNAIYVDDSYFLTSKLKFRAGIRYNFLTGRGISKHLVEPRIELTIYPIKNHVLRFAGNRMHQNVAFLANNGLSFPTDFWIPAHENLPIAISNQYSLGYGISLGNISLSTDVFYKQLNNLIGIKPGADYFDYALPIDQKIDLGLEGIIKGLEFEIKYEKKDLNIMIAYTLSKNTRRKDGINKGEWFFSNYDKTHDLSLVFSKKLSKKWEISNSFVFGTGRPFTLPSSYFLGNNGYGLVTFPVYEKYNNVRFPPNHRFDVSIIKHLNQNTSLSFGLYNAYANNNPFYIEYYLKYSTDESINPKMKLTGLFGPIPFINYTKKF